MTNEEAMEIILQVAYDGEFPINSNEAFEIACKCIEKQIPKPKHKYQGYRCVCSAEVAKNQDYCEYCGQRLKKGDEDDRED